MRASTRAGVAWELSVITRLAPASPLPAPAAGIVPIVAPLNCTLLPTRVMLPKAPTLRASSAPPPAE
jgi:hypothetical protein